MLRFKKKKKLHTSKEIIHVMSAGIKEPILSDSFAYGKNKKEMQSTLKDMTLIMSLYHHSLMFDKWRDISINKNNIYYMTFFVKDKNLLKKIKIELVLDKKAKINKKDKQPIIGFHQNHVMIVMMWHKNLSDAMILQLLLLEEITKELTFDSWLKLKLYRSK